MELEEERIREMEKMLEEEDDEDEDEDDGDEGDSLGRSQASILSSRPMSGKEARQQR